MNAEDIEQLLEASRQPLENLVRVQDAYDLVGWRVSNPSTAKFRHICLHMMRTTAEFARLAEHNDHSEDEGEPVSDSELADQLHDHGLLLAEAAFSVLQLASLGRIDLSAALHDLYRRNASYFAPNSAFADLEAWEWDEELSR